MIADGDLIGSCAAYSSGEEPSVVGRMKRRTALEVEAVSMGKVKLFRRSRIVRCRPASPARLTAVPAKRAKYSSSLIASSSLGERESRASRGV